MLSLLSNTWALLFGMLLLMMGNGMQGSLLGIRGAIEGFSAGEMSLVMSGYFLGFLIMSRAAPGMIRRVGHVRVFAAMGSIISAVFILYAAFPNVWAWGLMRVAVGTCFAAVYVVAESWFNDSATNENRGKALSLYMTTQMLGVISAQALLNLADPGGYDLFVLISVAVSLSFAPILLSVSPAPVHQTTKPMSLRALFVASPLGVVGTVFLGAVFSAIFGMSSVYGTAKGLSVAQISIFVALIYVGGLISQFPVGWLSDRMDRRRLILIMTALGAAAGLAGAMAGDYVIVVLGMAAVIGGIANPLYSLLIAHTNDYLEAEDRAAASGGLLFLNGVGAVGGPLAVGALMETFGPWAFFGFVLTMFAIIAVYAAWRMTRRPSVAPDETVAYTLVAPGATPVAADYAMELSEELTEAAAAASDEAEAGRAQDGAPPEAATPAAPSDQTAPDETAPDETAPDQTGPDETPDPSGKPDPRWRSV
ncbi:MFS transporter [uncultured Albimonas sp.]|uniref:MFS transporter n=1 Tax=uncultured Albimonas sp. TaxID=1331701 RepID=UPI0030EB126C|tara:strand:+ start:1722 stop:3158 length:1437 start_codon:yes stop_codon:yes gene_type:complete